MNFRNTQSNRVKPAWKERLFWGASLASCLLLASAPIGAYAAAEGDLTEEQLKAEVHSEEHPMGDHFLDSSSLIGLEVQDENGNKVGSIHDLMIDSEAEQVPFIVVSFNDFMGFGGELFALPWNGVTHNHEDETCVLSIQKESAVPSQEDQDWIDLKDEKTEGADQSEFGLTPYWVHAEEAAEADRASDRPKGKLLSANELVGSNVKSPEGEELGSVSELLVHSGNGDIACAVLTFGAVVGIGGKDYTAPISLIGEKTEEGFIIETDKESILKAPAYDAEKTLKSLDQEWVDHLRKHYKIEAPHRRHPAPRTSNLFEVNDDQRVAENN